MDYKKILKGVVDIINATENIDTGFANICTYISENCPELKEDKDEKIRKELKHYLEVRRCQTNNDEEYINCNHFLAWLEKQGESDETRAKMFLINKGYPIDTNGIFPTYEEMYNIIREGLEKQGKQKLIFNVDKAEPKFKVGYWITHNTANFVFKIINVGSNGYEVVNRENYKKIISFDNENNYHLWTIKDAEDGDVLVCNINKAEIGGDIEKLPNITPTICIYRNVVKDTDYIHCYCSLYDSKSLVLSNTMYYNTFVYNIHPATKEQRDLLFQKIKEAGCEWDSEKKELWHKYL